MGGIGGGLGLTGKTALVVGLANKNSLAFAIASALQSNGCNVGLVSAPASYERAKPSLALLPAAPLFHVPCDVTRCEDLLALREITKAVRLDCLVHSVAYASPAALTQPFLATPTADFLHCVHVSTISLISLLQHVKIQSGGSVVALSYLGAEKAVPNYNCMGPAKAALEAACRALAVELGESQIRVNAVSAGPINTLSARGIPGMSKMRQVVSETSPLRRNVTPQEVANTTAFLCGDLSSGITGQTIYVDAGVSSVAMVGIISE
ncbi:hypothetical protein H310_00010 [Aphanomyces invadans]|uniref:Enoyl-[acyl-carrier-protein] reductase [NADH] n=1 Tax=Aphanomyces invadans TaxID=157072 RepID=A0A024USV7_9STRA|nr:hypothetical protein H310_00010 [Aphanomyces invadans]ETW09399.1 hypothetical protein H310_00010 [Aphanomyces invadans]|eukprot:XP_008860810.1 hypothetical protein H310_00010 [Aphanomyces invadans]